MAHWFRLRSSRSESKKNEFMKFDKSLSSLASLDHLVLELTLCYAIAMISMHEIKP